MKTIAIFSTEFVTVKLCTDPAGFYFIQCRRLMSVKRIRFSTMRMFAPEDAILAFRTFRALCARVYNRALNFSILGKVVKSHGYGTQKH